LVLVELDGHMVVLVAAGREQTLVPPELLAKETRVVVQPLEAQELLARAMQAALLAEMH